MNIRIPKILIACPTSQRHSHLLDGRLEHLNKLNYPNFDLMMVDTTLENNKYFNILKKKKLDFIKIQTETETFKFERNVIVERHEWNPDKQHPVQMLADAREKIRQYFLKNEYQYLFFLDDDIFIPKNGIQRLISHNKDLVGFYVHVFPKGMHKPCVFKSGGITLGKGLDYYSFKEIESYKRFVNRFKTNKLNSYEKGLVPFLIRDLNKPELFKTYAVGIGCLMIKRKVLEQVAFRTHPTFINGEDLWFFAEANEKNFEFWCDPIRCRHENTEWNTIIKKSKKQMKFWVAKGYVNANEIVMVDRSKKK